MPDLRRDRPPPVALSAARLLGRRAAEPDRGAPGTGAWRTLRLVVALALVVVTPGSIRAAEPGGAYRFGVFPYAPPLIIDRIFGPIAASFGKTLGKPVYLKTKPSFEKFADALARQTYDIIFVHPFFYVEAADRYHYRPLARLDQPLTAMVMVAKDRAWHAWRDLAGRIVALPSELAAVSWMVKAALIEAGLRPGVDVALQHHPTKGACLQAAVLGTADACAVPAFALAQVEQIADVRLRVMIETPPIKHLVFAAHERVPKADRARLLAGILAWPRTAAGRAVLAAGAWSQFVVARDQDYDQVRRYRAQLEPSGQR